MVGSIIEILESNEETLRWPTIQVVGLVPRVLDNPQMWLIDLIGVCPADISGGLDRFVEGACVVVSENDGPKLKGRIIEVEHGGEGSGRLFNKLVVEVGGEAPWYHQRNEKT